MHQVYLGLGGNIGDSVSVLNQACEEIQDLKGISHFRKSSLYKTKPVSDIPQRDFVNMACSFYTEIPPHPLFFQLHEIEKKLGKKPKPKNAPRIVDIDMLYYGDLVQNDSELILPHPKILERLFVLKPLSDLTNCLPNIPNVKKYIEESWI